MLLCCCVFLESSKYYLTNSEFQVNKIVLPRLALSFKSNTRRSCLSLRFLASMFASANAFLRKFTLPCVSWQISRTFQIRRRVRHFLPAGQLPAEPHRQRRRHLADVDDADDADADVQRRHCDTTEKIPVAVHQSLDFVSTEDLPWQCRAPHLWGLLFKPHPEPQRDLL